MPSRFTPLLYNSRDDQRTNPALTSVDSVIEYRVSIPQHQRRSPRQEHKRTPVSTSGFATVHAQAEMMQFHQGTSSIYLGSAPLPPPPPPPPDGNVMLRLAESQWDGWFRGANDLPRYYWAPGAAFISARAWRRKG